MIYRIKENKIRSTEVEGYLKVGGNDLDGTENIHIDQW